MQELSQQSWSSGEPEAAEKRLTDWTEKKSGLESIRTVATFYVQTVIRKHLQDRQPDKALVAADPCRKLVPAKDRANFARAICAQWSQWHTKKPEWDKVITVFSLGLKSLSKGNHLTRNALVTCAQRANQFIFEITTWGEAMKICDQTHE